MRTRDWLTLALSILVFFALFLGMVSCEPAVFFPEEGEWYCAELQIQVCFDTAGACWMISQGETIRCTCGSDRGSDWLSVCSQDFATKQFDVGEEVFGGTFVRLEEGRLILLEPVSNREYTFIRVEETK